MGVLQTGRRVGVRAPGLDAHGHFRRCGVCCGLHRLSAPAGRNRQALLLLQDEVPRPHLRQQGATLLREDHRRGRPQAGRAGGERHQHLSSGTNSGAGKSLRSHQQAGSTRQRALESGAGTGPVTARSGRPVESNLPGPAGNTGCRPRGRGEGGTQVFVDSGDLRRTARAGQSECSR